MMQFPEPRSLDILEIHDGKDHRTMVYSLDKPHPGFGKDPNILNEYGHSVYPKMIYPNGKELPGAVVKNEKEEKEVLGQVPPHPTNLKAEKPAGDVLRQDGPTIQEYVEKGYKASEYPPKGYASKSSETDIKFWVDKEKEAGKAWG